MTRGVTRPPSWAATLTMPIALPATSAGTHFMRTVGMYGTVKPSIRRYYAVQFRLDNTGSMTYAEDANFEATVIDSAWGVLHPGLDLDTVSGCPAFPGTYYTSPGSSSTGCVVFDLPTAAAVKDIRYVPDSGQCTTASGPWAADRTSAPGPGAQEQRPRAGGHAPAARAAMSTLRLRTRSTRRARCRPP